MRIAESTTAIVARNETWTAAAAVSEPYEAGWAREVVAFVRNLSEPFGPRGEVSLEISADGMHWVAEGGRFPMPDGLDSVSFGRASHFGNWIRLRGYLPEGSEAQVIVTLHCKS